MIVEAALARLWQATVITFKLFGFLFKGIQGLIRMIIDRKGSRTQSSYEQGNKK